MKILVAINYVDYSDPLKKRLQEDAIRTMIKRDGIMYVSFNFESDQVILPEHFVVFKTLTRDSSKTIDNDRRLPYVKEILDKASEIDSDIFGYMNSDVLLRDDFFDVFKDELDVYMFSRYDIDSINSFKIVGQDHPGFDAVFFKKQWWMDNASCFNANLILGEPAWDDYYCKTVKRYAEKSLIQRRLYHVYHPTIWNVTSNGSKNNINIHYGGGI